MEACALPNQEAATVAEVLVKKFVARCGIPQMLYSETLQVLCSLAEMCGLVA